MKRSNRISRRAALKALGVSIGLPMLEIMFSPLSTALGALGDKRKKFIGAYFPNGALMPGGTNGDWTTGNFEGEAGALAAIFAAHGSNLLIPRGIAGTAYHDGSPYDPHWENGPGFLNCSTRVYGQNSTRAAKSLDQFIADANLPNSRIKSLHIGSPDREVMDAGFGPLNLIFANSVSWANDDTPNPNITRPIDLFRKIYGDGGSAVDQRLVKRAQYRKSRFASILDLVPDQRAHLAKIASKQDLATLDQYFTELRQIEIAAQTGCSSLNFESLSNSVSGQRQANGYSSIDAFKAPLLLVQKMVVKAMECDLTSAAAVMYMPVVASETCFIIQGIDKDVHFLAHNPSGEDRARLRRLTRIWVDLFSNLLTEIKSKPGLMDQTIAILGSDMSDGSHVDKNIPMLLAGAGADLKLGGAVGSENVDRSQSDLLREIATLYGLDVKLGTGIRAPRNQSTGILS